MVSFQVRERTKKIREAEEKLHLKISLEIFYQVFKSLWNFWTLCFLVAENSWGVLWIAIYQNNGHLDCWNKGIYVECRGWTHIQILHTCTHYTHAHIAHLNILHKYTYNTLVHFAHKLILHKYTHYTLTHFAHIHTYVELWEWGYFLLTWPAKNILLTFIKDFLYIFF